MGCTWFSCVCCSQFSYPVEFNSTNRNNNEDQSRWNRGDLLRPYQNISARIDDVTKWLWGSDSLVKEMNSY